MPQRGIGPLVERIRRAGGGAPRRMVAAAVIAGAAIVVGIPAIAIAWN